jgi:hypothetical protein
MIHRSFTKSALFALLAALACAVMSALLEPIAGRGVVFHTVILTAAAAYLALGPGGRLLDWAALLVVAVASFALGADSLSLAVGLALVIALARSARSEDEASIGPALRWSIELMLCGFALALAAHLSQSTSQPEARALWGYLLVQSAYPLCIQARLAWQSRCRARVDPFVSAARRLETLLGRDSKLSIDRADLR